MKIGLHEYRLGHVGDGVSSPSRSLPLYVTLHAIDGKHFVLHVPGHKRFAGQGQARIYAPASFEVWEIIGPRRSVPGADLIDVRAKSLLSFEVRR